jgi:hypothetical protein
MKKCICFCKSSQRRGIISYGYPVCSIAADPEQHLTVFLPQKRQRCFSVSRRAEATDNRVGNTDLPMDNQPAVIDTHSSLTNHINRITLSESASTLIFSTSKGPSPTPNEGVYSGPIWSNRSRSYNATVCHLLS